MIECRNVQKLKSRRFAVVIVEDRKSTRLNSSHLVISYAVFCLKKKKIIVIREVTQHRRFLNANYYVNYLVSVSAAIIVCNHDPGSCCFTLWSVSAPMRSVLTRK